MDEPTTSSLARPNPTRVAITVTLGAGTTAYVDEGSAPILIIDTGQCELLLEATHPDGDTIIAVDALVAAALQLQKSLAAWVAREGGGPPR